MKINLNDQFRVVLTAYGAKVNNEYMRQFPAKIAEKWLMNTGDAVTFPLWELMQIFGPRIHMGMNSPFENCVLESVE